MTCNFEDLLVKYTSFYLVPLTQLAISSIGQEGPANTFRRNRNFQSNFRVPSTVKTQSLSYVIVDTVDTRYQGII